MRVGMEPKIEMPSDSASSSVAELSFDVQSPTSGAC